MISALIRSSVSESFQSALPHGERFDRPGLGFGKVSVSIRASARGAISCRCLPRRTRRVSIRAPVGGRFHRLATRRAGAGFNPRPRAGGDALPRRRSCQLECFNPRPPQGAIFTAWQEATRAASFNPRPRAGGDACDRAGVERWSPFQSAPPAGGGNLYSFVNEPY